MLDAMLARPDVDPERVAVIGISQAGYWVPRALAFEHRLAAAAVDPGVVDVSSSWLDPLPEAMRNQLRDGLQTAFDREMHLVGLFSPQTAATLRFRGKPYGLDGSSTYALYQTVSAYQLGDEIREIATPVLITDPEGEQFWPGQSQQLYDHLRGPKHLVAFRSQDGAGRHCEPLACAQRDSRIFDWLANGLGDDHHDVMASTTPPAASRTR